MYKKTVLKGQNFLAGVLAFTISTRIKHLTKKSNRFLM